MKKKKGYEIIDFETAKVEGNPHSIMNLAIRMSQGEKAKDLEREIDIIGKKRAKEKGKIWGECESCSDETVLVEEVGLCGPCCFGEAETYNGNW
ncbi:MAG: hypothetical protein V4509_04575 [Patescibacteria group bacterium]